MQLGDLAEHYGIKHLHTWEAWREDESNLINNLGSLKKDDG